MQPGPSWDPNFDVLGQVWEKFCLCPTLSSQSWFPELPLRRQLFAARSQLGSQLECLWAGLGNFGPLPGPVQSECVSRAPLKEAAFCSQVPAGIPTWMSLGRFGKNWASVPNLSSQSGFPELLPGSLTCAAQAPNPDDMW